MEIFSDFPFLPIYLSLREKHTAAKTAVLTSDFQAKGRFPEYYNQAKIFFFQPPSFTDEETELRGMNRLV